MKSNNVPRLLELLFLFLKVISKCHTGNAQQLLETCSAEKEGATFDSQECSLYMAPSSVTGAGFGIFTTRDLSKGEGIIPYPDAPSIVICHYYHLCTHLISKSDWIHSNYVWGGNGFANFECESAFENVMTIGAITNVHTVCD